MEAVIATGGKQYRVAPGQVIKVERLDKEAGSPVEFTQVLLVSNDGGVGIQELLSEADVEERRVERPAP
jgi:large subunit ribosomal protein L21